MFYPMGARAMSGETEQHLQLERELADFVGKESAYLLNFGYQGMYLQLMHWFLDMM